MEKLTARQSEVLTLVREFIERHGFPPTLRELADGLGVRMTRGVVKHLEALERKGRLRRRAGSSRGIELLHGRPDQRPVRAVPVLGKVPAGPPDLAVEEMHGSLALDASVAGDATFLLRVSGDSMSGDHIASGDMVLVRKQDTAESGDLVVAMVDGEATVKRLRRSRDRVVLEPSNPDYPPLVLDEGSGEFSIVGRVKAVIRLLDRK